MTTSRATSNVRGFKNRSSIRTGSASEVLAKIFARLVIESGSDMPDKWARLMHDEKEAEFFEAECMELA
jgi:hypothetical protein